MNIFNFKISLLMIFLMNFLAHGQEKSSVYFGFDKRELSETEKNKVNSFIDKIDTKKEIQIKGYTDPIGKTSYNKKLSIDRANYLKNFLSQKIKIEKNLFKIQGEGIDYSSDIKNIEKRRVDIFYDKIKEEEPLPMAPLVIPTKKGRYSLGVALYQNTLDSYNERAGSSLHAEWVSQVNWEFSLKYQYNFFKNIWIGLSGSYHIQDYKIEVEPFYVWDEKDPHLFNVALISDWEKDKLGVGFDIAYESIPLIEVSGANVYLRETNFWTAKLRGQYKFFENEKYVSRLGASLSYLAIGSGQLNPDNGYTGEVNIDFSKKRIFKNHELHLQLFYGLKTVDYENFSQDEEYGGLRISIRSLRWL